MTLKSYFSATVEGAMALARQELGPEAMLIDSRPAPSEARHLGEYEVVFASELPGPRVPPQVAGAGRGMDSTGERLSLEIAELKKEIEGMRCALRRSAFVPPHHRQGFSQSFADAFAALAASEVDPDLAREIVENAEARLGRVRGAQPKLPLRTEKAGTAGGMDLALAQEIESRVSVAPALGRGDSTPRIVALVGPPGAGKTTTLVKLAVNYGLVCRRPVLLLSMDTYRIAAAEQLRSYAAILGVGFQVLETVAGLAQAIEENRGKELIFVDTPGLGAEDLDDAMGLARFLSTRTDIDIHLVLSASMKAADLSRTVDAYQIFQPQRLLFTKLDETGSYGPILNETVRTAKPLSFFAKGQRIPEDLEAAAPARLIELLLPGQSAAARSAA
jgi:flagellar biosynthesis protein FlhF